jgi:glycosyltransferase involved in cell wall biosynthesis
MSKNNPGVTCVVTAYKQDPSRVIQELLEQTYQEKQILVFCSDIDITPLREQFPMCEFFDVPNREDWGHSKRAMGIVFAEGEYICFCNADDEYHVQFLEAMVEPLIKENADLAYCWFTDKTIEHNIAESELKMGGITSGSLVVRTTLAKKVGWPYRVYAADWYFVRDLLEEKIKIVYVPISLMAHN